MTNLKPCPCGKTPTVLFVEHDVVFGDCCANWSAKLWDDTVPMAGAWNAAHRSAPAVCPQCHGDGVIADDGKLRGGDEAPWIECPTCAPFGGRGAIMVEDDHQQPEENDA